MKTKTLTTLALLSFLTLMSFSTPIEDAPQTSVYLCDSSGGKKYHYSKGCRGLSNCQHEIIKVSLEDAKKRGKTLCGWE
ncbi:hypothetical protein SAMN06296427_102123 [Moheibacter sediminis]|uniref:Uncharacterized protein n=2 Tax=Moheibacter sediminis TaxID=1434700 RepID=A0A1W1Z1Z3_9FLAO|nr:hypothetical protein SAMN06296427_102123 [Moheibacter sediminis]